MIGWGLESWAKVPLLVIWPASEFLFFFVFSFFLSLFLFSPLLSSLPFSSFFLHLSCLEDEERDRGMDRSLTIFSMRLYY